MWAAETRQHAALQQQQLEPSPQSADGCYTDLNTIAEEAVSQVCVCVHMCTCTCTWVRWRA